MFCKELDLVAIGIPELGESMHQYDQWTFTLYHKMHANAISDDVAMAPGFGCGCHRETLFSSGIVIDDRSFYLLDQVGYGDTTGASIGAVEACAATPHALALSQDGQAFLGTLIATIEDEAVRIHDRGRPDPVGIAPYRWA